MFYVYVYSQYGNSELMSGILTLEEALKVIEINTGEDTDCILIEGKEIKYTLRQIAEVVK